MVTAPSNASKVSFRRIFMIATPVLFANIAMPLQNIIDVGMTSRFATIENLAGLGLAVQLMSVLLISFNFLQYSSSGLVAQTFGSKSNTNQLLHILQRAMLLACALGICLLAFESIISQIGLGLLSDSPTSTQSAKSYLQIRFFGVIAELLNFVFVGFFAGMACTRVLLILQSSIAFINIICSVSLVWLFGFDLSYIALGTVIAHWFGVFLALFFVARTLKIPAIQCFKIHADLTSLNQFLRLLKLNKDIFIRTLLLTLSFAWLTRLAAMHSDLVLSSTVILLQILSISSYALDGLAIASETLSGQAAGNKNLQKFNETFYKTGLAIFGISALLSFLWWIYLDEYLHLTIQDKSLFYLTKEYAIFAVIMPVFGSFAYWLDGVYFGLTAGRQIRYAALITGCIFFPISSILYTYYEIAGIWLSLILLFLLRAITLAVQLPKLKLRIF